MAAVQQCVGGRANSLSLFMGLFRESLLESIMRNERHSRDDLSGD